MKLKLLLIFSFFILHCSQAKITGALVLYSTGEVKSGGQLLKPGDRLAVNESIATGPKAFCDLQILGLPRKITIRIKKNSKFRIRQKTEAIPHVSKGNALFKIENGDSNQDSFRVETPLSLAGVRGTQFEISVNRDKSTRIATYEGLVEARFRFSELEDAQELQNSNASETLVARAKAHQIPLAKAKARVFTTKEIDNIYATTGIQDALKKSDRQEIDKTFTQDKLDSSLQEQSKKIEKISDSEMKSKLEEFTELIALELSKLTDEEAIKTAISARNKKLEKKLKQRKVKMNQSKSKNCFRNHTFWDCMFGK